MEVFNLVAKLVLDKSEYDQALNEAEQNGEKFSISFSDILDGIKDSFTTANIIGIVTKIGSAMVSTFNKTLDYADAVDKGSQKIGISAEAYQKLDYALGMSGASVNNLSRGVKNLNAIITGTASKGVAEAFAQLGVDTEDANGNLRDTSDVLQDVLMKLASMEQSATRDNFVEMLFGAGSGQVLKSFLNEGEKGIKKLYDEAEDYGLIMSDEAIKQNVETKDSMDRLGKTIDALGMNLMSFISPAIDLIADGLALIGPAVNTISGWIGGLADAVVGFAKWLFNYKTPEEIARDGARALEHAQYVADANERIGYQNIGKTAFLTQIDPRQNVSAQVNSFSEQLAEKYGEETGEYLKTLLSNAVGTNKAEDWDAFYEELGKVESGIQPVVDSIGTLGNAAESAAAKLLNAGSGEGSHASGLWNVPYDGYRAELHRGETILNASRARAYRNGEGGGGNAALLGMIQHLENTLENLTLQVNGRDFGRAAVDYSGQRMNSYIGGAENRLATGYGS